MEQATSARSNAPYSGAGFESYGSMDANSSGVSWPAVIAGAFAAAALSLILLALGTGLGLSSTSPWANTGASASTLGTAAILWLIFTEIASSAIGGYLAGRLRTKWTGVHTDEVYFRDTAHGFLAWCVALVVSAAFLASAAAAMVGAPSRPGTNAAESSPNAYFVDSLFRSGDAKHDAGGAARHSEADAILARSLKQGELSGEDKAYLGQMVSADTGMNQQDSGQRVSSVFANAQQAADAARKAAAHSLLWMFITLLIGAFCASLAATLGGRQRDHVVLV